MPDDITSECVTVARADSGTCIIAKPEAVTMNSTRFSSTIMNLKDTILVVKLASRGRQEKVRSRRKKRRKKYTSRLAHIRDVVIHSSYSMMNKN